MIFSGLSPDGRLVEIAELRDHPWMVGSQFHPEFKSRPGKPHPLFDGLVRAAIEFSPEQAAFLEKLNPFFWERHVESSVPGELLSAETFFLGSLKGIGKVYLHAVVDTFGSYAFGFLHVSKQPEAAVAVLHNDVLPFYRDLDLPVKAVLTDNGREFCGTERHPYELYLDLNGIEHRRTKVKSPKTNGFVERFNGSVLDEFFSVKMRETLYKTVEALQTDLEAWLVHYDTERPHLGCRNQGRRPVENVMSFVSQEGSVDT